MQSQNSAVYEFGDFRIDVNKRLLFKGENENLALTPKVFDTLLCLVERRGEVVGKDELLSAVWPDTVVEENNLSQNISMLRRVLGEKRSEHRFIVTIPGRGYKFVAQVREVPNPGTYGLNRSRKRESIQAEQLDIWRRGNVLALADWKASEVKPEFSELTDSYRPDPEKSSKRHPRVQTIAGTVAISTLAVTFAFALFWFANPFRDGEGVEGAVLNVTRLTNGFLPYDATISPDGKYFVYHEIDGDNYRMWLQQTGHSIRTAIIPSTDKALSVKTFSPDGQYVYFVAMTPGERSRSLYRILTLGGNPTKVLTDIDSYVSFSPDGSQMVFARYDETLRELQYVIRDSSGSGDERILFRRGLEQYSSGSAAWSPDGNTVIIDSSVISDEGRYSCELATIPADGGKPVTFSRGWGTCYRIAWRHDGRGVYMIGTREGDGQSTRRDQLFYVSYPDGRSSRLTTEDSRHQLGSLGVTSAGSVLVAPFNRSSQIWKLDASGDSRTAVQITSGNADGRAGIAPLEDGRIAFLALNGENLNIWLVDQEGANLKQVNFAPPFVEELRSSVAAKNCLVFSAPQGKFHHLFRINSDGADMRQLTFGESFEVDSGISHDGRWVVYTSSVQVGTDQKISIWKIPIEGGEPIMLYDAPCSAPLFSPDDRFISCVRDYGNVQIISASDGSVIRSFATLPLSVLNFGAVWAPDGKSIVYIVNEKGDVSNLWQHPIDGSPARRLTDFSTGSIYRFAYSFDGQRLYLARGQQIRDALLIKHSLPQKHTEE